MLVPALPALLVLVVMLSLLLLLVSQQCSSKDRQGDLLRGLPWCVSERRSVRAGRRSRSYQGCRQRSCLLAHAMYVRATDLPNPSVRRHPRATPPSDNHHPTPAPRELSSSTSNKAIYKQRVERSSSQTLMPSMHDQDFLNRHQLPCQPLSGKTPCDNQQAHPQRLKATVMLELFVPISESHQSSERFP
ncbi:uncharacterized protein K452DRAFT_312049 [Aplosporella prunicola CBS 121167]|uniref:Secreted protein n=1 Tax=Aplosporella prunicola CBS 121167 TaxID=1176127 RepID=A0A6A6B1J7_9PEZI|nr:uncharacterized protein K452DRAFT_312049 [Aplosporella prunicola CBS 121167]KAF2137920.1 hypothetical protein K452DRAFT_312049 [Aplosporella prunicola CBS 121167]